LKGVAPMRIIQLEQATKRFNEHIVLNNITVSFKQGLIHGIIGRNGSGKTMLLKVICGFVPLTSGKIFVNNVQLGKGTDVPSDVGIIIETPGFLPNYSAFQNLKLLAKIKNKVSIDRIQEVMCLVGLDPDNKKHVSKLSMGMRQRLGISQAIMENPSLLILDEPFNGLDANGIEDMRNLLLDQKERGKTILMASHSSEDIKCLCDNVIRMEQGRIT
jgi:ABC-2 type transport system ATP-binding protein